MKFRNPSVKMNNYGTQMNNYENEQLCTTTVNKLQLCATMYN